MVCFNLYTQKKEHFFDTVQELDRFHRAHLVVQDRFSSLLKLKCVEMKEAENEEEGESKAMFFYFLFWWKFLSIFVDVSDFVDLVLSKLLLRQHKYLLLHHLQNWLEVYLFSDVFCQYFVPLLQFHCLSFCHCLRSVGLTCLFLPHIFHTALLCC